MEKNTIQIPLERAKRRGTIFENGICILCDHGEEYHFFGGCTYRMINSHRTCPCKGNRGIINLKPGYLD